MSRRRQPYDPIARRAKRIGQYTPTPLLPERLQRYIRAERALGKLRAREGAAWHPLGHALSSEVEDAELELSCAYNALDAEERAAVDGRPRNQRNLRQKRRIKW